ncbi:MAG: hypothetical protein E7107_14580 [Prevotella sp.]|nr:hypothetical protein [Prevotella sp.]
MKKNIHTRLASLVFMSIIQFTYCIAQDKLSGTSSVSPTGAAVYSVAFEAPKGVGDLKPSIGISYNSQTGNGLVGWGCNITGFSSITRGMKDWAHDNTIKGISYDTGCALYLDGKRLLLKSGTEGTDGCIYSPEGEPQTSVTLHSSLTSSTCWFEVDTSDGMVYEYGHIDGRQTISNPTAVTAWYVDKATNPLGQYISYTYQNVNLFLYPASITYGGNNSILFEYENRTDTIPFVLRDNGGYVAKRLKSVTTKAGNEIYRTYTMAYTYDGNTETHFSRLQSVTEKGEDGYSTHVLSTSWNNLSSYSPSYQETSISVPSSYSLAEYGERFLLAGDINNDGISEFIHISPVITYNSSGMNERFFYIDVYNSDIENGAVSYDHRSFSSFRDPFDFLDWSYRKGVSSIVDMNGDGINDFIIPCCDNANNNGTYTFYFKVLLGSDTNSYSTRKLFAFTNMVVGTDVPLYQVIDLDNNGKNNIILLEKNGQNGSCTLHLSESSEFCTYYQKNLTLSSAPKHLYASDFNHDGLVDIMVVCSDGCRIFYNQGGSSLQNVFVDSSTLNTGLTNHDRMEMGDFNGDGIVDFIWNDNLSQKLYFEMGNVDGTFTCREAYDLGFIVRYKNSADGTWSCMVNDLDHDGKSDIVLNLAEYYPTGDDFKKSHTYWLLSNGYMLTKKKEATSTRFDDAKAGHIFAGDFKGQGFLEVANYGYDCYNGSNANTDPTVNVYSCSNQNISNGKIASFTDSHGRSTAFTYASLTSDLVYTKGTSAEYPLLDVVAPLCVTSQVSETGGSPISTETNYTYAGLRAHLTGRGLLGFREMTASETYSGKTITTTTSNDAPIYFVPRTITTTTSQANTTSTSVNNITLHIYDDGIQNNYALYPVLQTTTDIYGNVTTVTKDYNVNKGVLVIEQENKDNGNFYQKTTYGYGSSKVARAWRPVLITQEQKHPDDTNYFRKYISLNYDNYGQKTSVVDFFGSSKPLTTAYQYDVNGNVTSETLSGNGIGNDAVTYYQYSNDGKFLTQKSNVAGTIGYTYNAFGELTAETNLTDSSYPLTTYYYRNGFGMLTMEDKPTGERTEWERATTSNYDGAYYVISHKYGSPEVTTVYDTFGNELYTETEGIGEVIISTANSYNNFGKLSQQERTHGELAIVDSYSYDNLGRLLSFSSTDGTEIDYEYYDRMIVTTENGKEFTKYYDAWGNVTESTDSLSSVSYTYSSNGKPSEVECENSTISIQYDIKGNQISLNDPDAGTTTYGYDAMNRLIQQTDARDYVTSFTYDGAGRITEKTVGGTTTTYTYGTSGGAAGQLVEEQNTNGTISYTYDNCGRLSQETRTFGLQELTFGYSYDSNGRLSRRTYPQNVNVDYAYNDDYLVATAINGRNISYLKLDNGLTQVYTYGGKLINRGEPLIIDDPIFPNLGGTAQPMDWPQFPVTDSTDVDPGLIYYPDSLVNQPDPWGQALIDYYYVHEGLGTKTITYDSRGYPSSLSMYRGQSALRHMTFSFEDGTGNLLSRTGMGSQTEDFTYDCLDRLTSVSGSNYQTFTYDPNGNQDYKSGAGYLSYGTAHPHAVIGATNDGDIPLTPQSISYTPFGKILSISEGNYTMDFTYGPDEERWKTELTNGNSLVRTTIYGDNYEQVTDANGQTRHIYYLDGAVYVLDDGATSGRLYFAFTDHLGSITRLYSEYGNEVFAAEYDAWGKQTVTVDSLDFRHGYTGHEMMPEFGLINMNGRLYDPVLGRFLSPDNYVQLPDFSQSFNRYSYCLNNPLKYTDPNGELFGIDDIIFIAAMAYIGGTQANLSHSINNGTNPFNPLAWNWRSFGTYLGIAEGALNGAGMVGMKVFSMNVPGIVTNGVLHAAGNVVLNGVTNWTEGNNFFDNWGWSALAGFIEGAIGGYAESKIKGKNYWWGNEIKYNRTQWSLINTDKPDEIIEMLSVSGGSERLNDCVPTTLYEIEQVRGGNRTYDYFINSVDYNDNGVTLSAKSYKSLMENNFSSHNVVDITKKASNIFDSHFMKNVASTNGVITIQFHNPGHADNVRALKVFNRMPQMNTLIFRQKLYNVNQLNFHTQNTPLKILWIK